MISVNLVYKTVLTLLNTAIRGNVKPADAMLAINNSVNEIVSEYHFEVNRALNRQNKRLIGTGFENVPELIMQKINHFLIDDFPITYNATTKRFELPSNLRFLGSVFYDNENEVEFQKDSKNFKLISNFTDTTPTNTYPIGLKIADTIKIAPDTIIDKVTISYLRSVIMANWTYSVIMGAEVFNPSSPSFRDIDLHQDDFNSVVLKTLKQFGMNLKEQDIQAVTQGEEIQNFNKENAS